MSQPQAVVPPAPKTKSTPPTSKLSSPSLSAPATSLTTFRRLQIATGFSKPSSLRLFITLPCVFSLFCIISLPSLSYENVWSKIAAPGEWYWYSKGIYRIGMTAHLWSVIPAGVLMPLQFVPVFRRRYISLHRLNGYLLLSLLMVGNLTALIISRHALGGTFTTQAGVISLAIQTTFTLTKAIVAIRNLRIDKHRTWMIRTWGMAASILTIRIFTPIAIIASLYGVLDGFKVVTTCAEILFMYNTESIPLENVYSTYPTCKNINSSTSTSPIFVIVDATFDPSRPETLAGTLSTTFGAALWASQIIHFIGVEWYLRFSKGEDERLRKVSLAKMRPVGLERLVESEH